MQKCSLIIAIALVSLACAQVDVYVYESDEITPFDDRQIMVGEELTLIINSDSNDYWQGSLFIDGNDRAFGTLSGRGYDTNSQDYTESHFQDAGTYARVTGWTDSSMWGFDMYTYYPTYPTDTNLSESNDTVPGDWFIIDYKAEKPGDCNVLFYDGIIDWNEPTYALTFSQIPSRDFDDDGKVDFVDYSTLAVNWGRNDCNDPNWCDGTDLDMDGSVDFTDLLAFIDYWLWPASPGVAGSQPIDSNIVLRIVDVNDNNEITIDVNSSVTLYLKLTTTTQGSLDMFDVDVLISDVNLGSIDNREYDPSDPNDPNNGTARILATPRDSFFDYVGPGWAQEQGIHLTGITWNSSFNDGNLASFVFTCKGEGDVTLSLKNCLTFVFPKLENMLIHQYDPNSQMLLMGGGTGGEELESFSSGELATWLEDIRVEDPNISAVISEDEWEEFVEAVDSGESY